MVSLSCDAGYLYQEMQLAEDTLRKWEKSWAVYGVAVLVV